MVDGLVGGEQWSGRRARTEEWTPSRPVTNSAHQEAGSLQVLTVNRKQLDGRHHDSMIQKIRKEQ